MGKSKKLDTLLAEGLDLPRPANPKAVGELAEAKILSRLIEIGRIVLIPFGNNQRYDLVVDDGAGTFVRGQCKSSTYTRGCITFGTVSRNGFTGVRRSYEGQIDVFWVFSPELKKVYEVPHIGGKGFRSNCSLRVDPPTPRSIKRKIRQASDYEL